MGTASAANMQQMQMNANNQGSKSFQGANGSNLAGDRSAGAWVCRCGATNTGKFCSECGNPKPVADTWVCRCGAVNTGKFCSECGALKG